MCGIAGIATFDGSCPEIGELQAMNRAQSHRGPDGEGFFAREGIGLAHCRLAIIDPAAGVQPFFNDDRSVVLSFNGEIYNYLELKDELAPHFRFRTQSDTEVLLRAYERWGMACLDRFHGMFAFALYDGPRNKLFLARDRVGIKPLYYCPRPGRLLFASEFSPLLGPGGSAREIDTDGLSGFFRYQYVPAPLTIYRDVRKVLPGNFLEVDLCSGRIDERAYWELRIQRPPGSEADFRQRLDECLDRIMRMYVRSDVDFGAFLSGGVDSSLVAGLMRRQLGPGIRTFTIGFEEEIHSELPFALEASRTLGCNHTAKVVTPDLAEEILGKLAGHFGEPFADSSAIPTFYVSREASRQVKMVLSGDGGDELFGGYNSYRSSYQDWAGLRGSLPARGYGALARYGLLPGLRRWARDRRAGALQAGHDAQRQIFGDADLRDLLAPGVSPAPAVPPPAAAGSPDVDPVTLFQAQDFKTYLVDDVLTKVDRMSMANSLEVRVPLLDHALVELAFCLPLDLKLRPDQSGQIVTKYLLKQSAARFYPPAFLERPKQGFGIPVVEWCQGPLRPLIESKLRNPAHPMFEWVRPETAARVQDEFFGGQVAMAARLWFLFSFALWMDHVHARNAAHNA